MKSFFICILIIGVACSTQVYAFRTIGEITAEQVDADFKNGNVKFRERRRMGKIGDLTAGPMRSVEDRAMDKGIIFTDKEHGEVRLANWGGTPCLFKLGKNGEWVEIRKATEDDMYNLLNSTVKKLEG